MNGNWFKLQVTDSGISYYISFSFYMEMSWHAS